MIPTSLCYVNFNIFQLLMCGSLLFYNNINSTNQSKRMNQRDCYNCKKPGHIANECQEPRAERGGDRRGGYNNKGFSSRCYKCNGYGHISKDCNETSTESKCYNCEQFGHISKDCTN